MALNESTHVLPQRVGTFLSCFYNPPGLACSATVGNGVCNGVTGGY